MSFYMENAECLFRTFDRILGQHFAEIQNTTQ
jgi:hypothetical protein